MASRDKALEVWDLLRQAEREIRDAENDASILRGRLLDALGQAAVPFDPLAGPEALAAAAQAAVDHEARTRRFAKPSPAASARSASANWQCRELLLPTGRG